MVQSIIRPLFCAAKAASD